MNVDDLNSFYQAKNDKSLSKILNITKGTVSKWRKKGISPLWQASFELATHGKLKADRQKIPHIPQPKR